ncbi:MAG: polysaccharide biosynthesis/export family protein [Calditrichia bacterium]
MFKYYFLFFVFMTSTSIAQGLNPGDGVRVTLYNISDPITGDYFTQQDGNIQLPYIGLIQVLNRDFGSVQNEIIFKYDSLYRNPELTVQPLYKVSILGEVRTPGRYFVTGVEKLSDILAMAGGETSDSNLDKIYFIRENRKININAKEMLETGKRVGDVGLHSGDQIYVPRKWWVGVRNASVIVSGVAVLVAIVGIIRR